jgi:hypothetical protein
MWDWATVEKVLRASCLNWLRWGKTAYMAVTMDAQHSFDAEHTFRARSAIHGGQLRAELARAGTPIGPYDQLIAGHARSQGLVLVTNNVREFERVPGLRIEDWL